MKVTFFKDKHSLRQWFEKNHDIESEIWIGFYKKSSGKTGVSYDEVLDVALCFGWIDGIRKSIDEISYCNRYTPRTARSKWSKINTEKVQRLIKAKLMMPSGLKAVNEAKADGRWDRAYDSPKNAEVPEDFLKEIKKNKKALAAYEALNKQQRFSISYKLQNTVKPETRERWIKKFIQELLGKEVN